MGGGGATGGGSGGGDAGFSYPSTLACTSCDCGLDGGFDLYLGTPNPPFLQVMTANRDDVTAVASFAAGTATLAADAADGGTITVLSTGPVVLSKGLVSGKVSWSLYIQNAVDWITFGGSLSAAGNPNLISHTAAQTGEELGHLAPVTAFTADPDAGVVTVTIDGQAVSASQLQTVEFDRAGQRWCLHTQFVYVDLGQVQSGWSVYALDAVGRVQP